MNTIQKIAKLLGCLAIVCLPTGGLRAQSDTLALARQAVAAGNYQTALQLLGNFEKSHPDDTDAQRLLAHVHYWSGSVAPAKSVFEAALARHPGLSIVQLEYGRMLFELHELEAAKSQLTAYLRSDPKNAEALLNLGHIHFWQGKTRDAEQYFRTVTSHYPGQPVAEKMLADIRAMRALNLELDGSYETDSQPLDRFSPSANVSQWHSDWLHPGLRAEGYFFKTETGSREAQLVELRNRTHFRKTKIDLSLTGGIFRSHLDQGLDWTGAASLKKQLLPRFSATAEAKRSPALLNRRSLDRVLFRNDFTLQLDLTEGPSWMGRAAVSTAHHGDGNGILTAFAWGLSPALRVSIFEGRLGYAFSYSDTRESRFRSEKSLVELLDNWSDSLQIEGIYDPYFTPQHQQIHSLLGLVRLSFSEKMNVELSGNVGLLARMDVPYLYLDLVGNELGLAEDFFEENTTTYDLSGQFNLRLSANVWATGRYRYFRNFFYEAHTVGAGLKLGFMK